MAVLVSVTGEMRLTWRLLGKSNDPFQTDLEWFAYELSVEGCRPANAPGAEPIKMTSSAPPSHVTCGTINRKDLSALLSGLDLLATENRPLRFEPYDLNFYFEWSHETPLVYLIVTWFDAALTPRRFDQRFPPAHVGFRFLTSHDAVVDFRQALAEESVAAAPAGQPKPSTLLQ
ncbi:MAG TPA: hypothetical protein VG204_16835 [Terriglobia bacterium]|nr:hypothetical protein [Terriglobia bacterium]